jgi:NADPH:quinone reductase-like Zn-dependent oxidoreductase
MCFFTKKCHFALKETRLAHEALEGRKTTGKILLLP